jgi:hypothetical protein
MGMVLFTMANITANPSAEFGKACSRFFIPCSCHRIVTICYDFDINLIVLSNQNKFNKK